MTIHGQFTFWVDEPMQKRLNAYCALHGVNRSSVLRSAVELFFANQVAEALVGNTTKPAAQAGSTPIPLVELDWS